MPEFSERGRYVTEQVALWLENDGPRVESARNFILTEGTAGLEDFVTTVCRFARKGDAAWHVAQELAPNDWARVDWVAVRARLL